MELDRDKIDPPKIHFTEMASSQLKLMIQNDPTVSNKFFRILISGKGCDGFTYQVGFSEKRENDFSIQIEDQDQQLISIIDPFSANYMSEITIDYKQDFVKNEEGFVVKSHVQKNFHGKFWLKDQTKLPPVKESN